MSRWIMYHISSANATWHYPHGFQPVRYASMRVAGGGPNEPPGVLMSHRDSGGIQRSLHVALHPDRIDVRQDGESHSYPDRDSATLRSLIANHAAHGGSSWPHIIDALVEHPDLEAHALPFAEAHTRDRAA